MTKQDKYSNEKSGINKETIIIETTSGNQYVVPMNTKIIDLIPLVKEVDIPKAPIMAALIDNRTKGLDTELYRNCQVEFIDMSTEIGMQVYSFGLIFVLARAVADLFDHATVVIKYSLGNAIYGEIKMDRQLRNDDITLIEEKMKEIIDSKEPFQRSKLPKAVAMNLFSDYPYGDRRGLLNYMESDMLQVVTCGTYTDFCLDTMVPHTGYLKVFRLKYYLPGFLLIMPRRENPAELPEYVEPYKLANVMQKTDHWADILKIHDVVSLNQVISSKDQEDVLRLIRMAEGHQEKEIIKIADTIAENIDRIRIVLIAGPSASGKTTFIQRLATQLRINGLNPVSISLDDYFLPRSMTPKDENGEYDFENLDAIDRTLFNEHLMKIIQGEEIELPEYNFTNGERSLSGKKLTLAPQDLVIMEGIHGLNDELTPSIPKSRKFKIYISALTHLNMDNLHRIHTTDLRLLRRMVRDYQFRGRSPYESLRQWASVRRGEERNIFPFQDNADVMFNSALVYELAVLKKYAEPLLERVSPYHREYAEARRLLYLLGFFLPLEDTFVDSNSIIREFIGSNGSRKKQ